MSDLIPVIGITTYRQNADWRGWPNVLADLLPAEYAQAVEQAGAVAVMLPPVATAAHAAAAAARLDGLILAGGADINPARYGEEPVPEVTVWMDDRDASELFYIAAADEHDLPILGICRGMQMLAVARGGRLDQHIPALLGNESHSGGPSYYHDVDVTVPAGYRISDLLPEQLSVDCHHHQGVAEHPGFVATATSADGYLHAMEEPGDRFVVAVQWHPEAGAERGLFRGLVAAAQDRAAVSAR